MSYPFNQMPDHESVGVDEYGKRVVLKGSSVPDSQPVPTKLMGSNVQLIANGITVLAGATYRPSGVRNYNGKLYGAFYVKSTQTYDIKLKPYADSGGTILDVSDIVIASGQAPLAAYRVHDIGTAIRQVLYGNPTFVNTAASDATVTIYEVVK